ncbi:Autotransporter adhesin [Bibersteinia trehalosi USDA-ARS-USMARC-192]|nr:Autotransporter adhesin [Bibersteinia trehalosi USDA-ARS-USMARC-192]
MLGIPSNVEAAVAIQSITQAGGVVYNDTNASTPGQLTYAYNYYNPGSKSYKDATMNEGTGNRYAEVDSTGITIGVNTSAIGKRNQFANGIAIGDHAQATGGLAVSIGHLSQALDIGSVALGTSSRAVGFNSLAAMRQSVAVGDFAIAIGSTAWADSNHSLAIGSSATAKGRQSFAIGSADYVATEDNSDSSEARRSKYDGMNNTQTNGNRSFAIGSSAKTNGDNSFAFGSDANTGSFDKVTDAYLNADVSKANTSKQARNAFALGTTARALDGDAFAIGTAAQASNNSSFAIGTQAKASDKNAFALGTTANASGQNSVAFGVLSNATHTDSIAFGVQSKSFNNKAIALGTESLSNGTAAVSVGSSSKASGERSISIGADANVSQKSGGSIAIGENAMVDAKESTAVGMQSKALSNFSTSIGASSRVAENAESGMAIGHTANVTAANATAIGTNAVASHKNAVALGQGSVTREATSENTTTVNGITYSGFAGNNPSSVVSVGNATSGAVRQIVNVAAGNISKDSTDAINGSQLYLVAVEAGKKSFVKAGTNTEVKTTAHANGSVTYTVDAMKTIADQGSDYITVTSSNEGNNTLKYTIDLNQTAKDAINQVANNTQNITNINNTIKQGWNITTTESNGGKVTGSSTANVQLGELVTIDAGQNINITQADRKISIATSLDPKFNSVTTNNFTVNASGVVNMGGNTVQNVANGTNATDAVNLQQLNASKSVVKAGNYTNVTSSSDANGTVYTVNADKSVVKAGTNVNVTTDTDGKGLTNYTVKVDGDLTNITSITNNVGNKLTIGNGTTTVEGGKAKVSDNSNATDIATVGDIVKTINNVSWAVAGNGAVKENITAGEVVNFANGNNSVAVVTANNTTGGVDVKFNVEGDLKNISSLTNNGTTITIGDTNNNKVVNVNGANITNVANGTNATDAVNLQQLNASKSVVKAGNYTTVTSTSDANGTVYTVNAEKSVVKAGNNVNVTTETDGKGLTNYTVKVEGDLTNISSITNNGTTIKLDNQNGNKTVDVGGATITNVAAGVNLTDAVNVGQLEKVNATANAGWNVTTNNGNQTYNVKPNATVDLSSSDGNIVIGQKDGNITFALAGNLSNITNISNGDNNSIRLGDNNNITTIISNGTTFTFGAGNTTVNVSGKAELVTGTNSTDVATVGDIIETINGVSWTLAGNGANVSQIKAGDIVNFVDGKNTKASAKVNNGATEVTYNVEGDLTNITSITNNGTTIKLENKDGDKAINVDGATITNVKAGENGTDAVNLDQLNASKSVVKAGNYTTVTSTSDANGTVYTVNAEKSVVVAGTNANVTTTTDGKGLTTYNVSVTGDLTNITSITNNEGNKLTIGNGTTTVDAGKAKVSNNSNATDIATVGDIVNTINNVSWAVAGNGAVKENITAGEVVNFVNGNNTVAVVTANTSTGGADVKFNVEGALSNITSLTNNNGTQITLGDTNNNNVVNVNGANITNVANGTNATDAVNLQQLNASKSVVKAGNYTTVTSTSDANGTVYTVNAEKSVVKAGNNVNVTTETDGKGLTNYTVKVEGDLTNISSITNNGTTIKVGVENGNNTVNIGGATITEVKAGVNGTDAVNVDQLEKVNSTANAGWNVSTNKGGTTYNVKPNATVDLRNADGNIVISQDNGNITFDLAGKLTNITNISNGDNHSIRLGDNNNVTTIVNNGTTFTFGEGNTTTNATTGKAEVASGSNNTDVATVGDIVETINNVSWTVAGNGSDVSKIKAGDVVNFVNGNNTVAVVKLNETTNATDVTYHVEGDLTNITSITNGNTSIKLGDANGNNTVNINNATISNVAPGVNGTDAVNVDQLEKVNSTANAGWNLTVNTGENGTNISPNATVDLRNSDGNIVITKDANNVTFDLNSTLTVGGKDGKDGQMGVAGKDGKDGVTIYGNGTIGINGKDGIPGKDGQPGMNGSNATVTVVEGTPGINGKDGETLTRVVYTDANGTTHEIATLDDGLKFKGDKGEVIAKKLGETLDIIGKAKDDAAVTDKNLRVDSEGGQLVIKMASDLRDINNITSSNGNTTITLSDSNGNNTVNINNATISNVAPGVNGTDAVNVDQLEKVNSTANAGWNLTVNTGENGTNISPNATVDLRNSDGNIVITKDANNVTFDLNSTLTIGGKDGQDGQMGVAGKDGADGVTIYGNGTIGINGKDGIPGKDGQPGMNGSNATVTVVEGTPGINGKDGETLTRVVYTDANGTTHEIATLDDGLKFKGDTGEVIAKKLGETLEIIGRTAETANVTDKNLRVDNEEGKLVLKMAKELQEINSISNNNGTTITLGDANNNNTVNINNATISNVAPGVNGTDAVNVDQLEKVNATANAGWTITTNEGNATYNVKPNATVDLRNADGNIVISQDNGNITFDLNSTLTIGGKGKDGTDGKDGQLGVAGKDGKDGVTIYGNGTIGINGKDGIPGKDGQPGMNGSNATVTVVEGTPGINGKDGETLTRVVYTDANGTTHEIATLDDGLKFKGDTGEVIAKKLGETLEIIGRTAETANVTDKNLRVDNEEGKLVLKMAKELQEINSISNNNGTTITLGDANNNNTVNINNATISNVAPGVNGTDAVNVDQLEKVNSTANAGWNLTVNTGENGTNISPNATVDLRNSDGNIVITKDANNVTFDLNSTLTIGGKGKDGADGKDGQLGVAGKDGADGVTIYGNGTIGINGRDGIDGKPGANASVTVIEGTPGINGKDGETLTRVVYTDANGTTHEIATLDDGLKFKGDTGEVIAKKLGETLEIIGRTDVNANVTDKNLRVDNEEGKLVLKMAKELQEINSISNNNGTTITLGDANNNNTVNINNATISNVAPGVNGTDAVNVDQLEKVNATANAGWNLTVNTGENGTNISPNATVDLRNSDGNIVITKDANNVTFDLNSTLTIGGKGKDGVDGKDGQLGVAGKDGVDGVTIYGNGTIGINGRDGVDGKPGANASVTVIEGTPGINGKDGETLTRVVYTDANGTTHEIATLDDGLKFKGDKGEVIAKKLGETLEIIGRTDVNANVTDKNLRVDNENGQLVIKMASDLRDINNITSSNGNTTITLSDSNGNNTVNINNATISNVAPGVNGTDAVNVDQLEKVNATANAGWTITTNEGNATYNVKPNATVDLRNADGNIVISQDNGNITFDLNSTLTIGGKDGKDGQMGVAGKDGADGVTIYGNGTIGINGRDGVDGKPGANASVTVIEGTPGINGKDGETLTRVVYTDANGTTHEIATLDDGLKFKGDTGEVIAKKLGETLEIIGRTAETANVTDKNLRVDNENGQLVIKMASDLRDINNITSSNGNTTITLSDSNGNNTVNINNATISNVAPGVNGTDAVNVDQLEKVNATANAGWFMTTNHGDKSFNVKPNASVDLRTANNNLVITQEDGNITFGLSNNLNLTSNGSVTIGNTTIDNSGLTIKDGPSITENGVDAGDKKVTNVSNGTISAESKDAINGSQLYAVKQIAEAGWNLSVNEGEDAGNVAPGANVDLRNSDGNIVISKDANNVTFNLAKDIKVDTLKANTSVTVGNDTVHTSIMNNGITVKGENSTVTLTDKGLDNGGNKITNVAAGTNATDAVNVSQLNSTIAGVQWKLTGNNDNANATTVGSQTVSFNDSESVKANVDGVNVSFSVKAGELGNEAGKVTSNSTNGTVATVKNVADAINNSGWNIALTDGSNELVKPGDIVKFVNGSGTTANVAKNANGGVEVSFNVNNAEAPKVNEDGSINVPSSENGGSHYVNATTLATTVNNAAWNVDSKAAGGTVINVVNEKRVDSQAATKVKAGNTVNINAGNNIEITRSGADITVATSMTPTFNTVQVGGKEGVTLGSSTAKDGVKELSVGARGAEARITNVAPGIADTDAVNVGQLRGAVGNIHNHINKVDKRVRGVGANAAAGMALPQVYIPGKSMVAASAGTYGGESAVAVGYSRASDNGKLILKMTGTANSQGHLSGGVGVGYQW